MSEEPHVPEPHSPQVKCPCHWIVVRIKGDGAYERARLPAATKKPHLMGTRNTFSSFQALTSQHSLFCSLHLSPPPICPHARWRLLLSGAPGSFRCRALAERIIPPLHSINLGIHLQPGRAARLISWHKHTKQARQAPRSYLKPWSERKHFESKVLA